MGLSDTFKRERFGLVLIATSLLVIVLIGVLLLRNERDARRTHNRVQGLSLVRLLGRLPFDDLVGGVGRSPLEVMRRSQGNPDFAYAVVSDLAGRPLREVTAPGVLVPAQPVPGEPSGWTGEATVSASSPERPVQEFFAPVLEDGERVAQLRIGFFEPSLGSLLAGARLFATLSLLVFLLTPVSYLLLRREIRPLERATVHLRELARSERPDVVRIEASGELAEFVEAFNVFAAQAAELGRTARHEQTSLLAESRVLSFEKTRLGELIDALPVAVVALDQAGVTSYASGKLPALLGVASDEAVGRHPDAWPAPPEIRPALAQLVGGSGDGLAPARSVEVALDEERTVALSTHPLSADRGRLLLIRDATVESHGRRAQAEFVTHVAHELKTPLNVFAMYSETLLGEEGRSEAFRIEACNVLKDEAERLTTLVNTLLGIARIEMGSVTLARSRVKPEAFLEEVLEAAARGARGRELGFRLEIPPRLSAIHVDKELLRVALNNLLTNAVKYSQPGGEVVLGAEESTTELRLFVRDQGIGIREGDLHRLFDKFFRSDSPEVKERPGHGLGLSLVKEICDLHGAQVQVRSAPDEGSEFTLVFRKNVVLTGEGA